MNSRRILQILQLIIISTVIAIISCSSPLMDVIEEEVAIAVSPPSVVSLYPLPDSVSIPVDLDDILITFTKGIDSSSVNNSTFVTKDSNGNTVSGTFSVTSDTIAFNPSSNLSFNTIYTSTAKASILDLDGNTMLSEFSWNFTTEIAPPGEIPEIDYFRIDYGKSATNSSSIFLDISARNVVGISSEMEFRYREVGDIEWSIWLPLTDGFGTVSGTVINVSPGVSETYSFEAEVRNLLGNTSLVSIDDIYYEEEQPTILANFPEDNSIDYPSNKGYITITFSEPMDPNTISSGASGSFYLLDGSTRIDGISVQYIDQDPNNNYPDNTAILTGLELNEGVGYVAFLASSATDVAGNSLSNDHSWFFRTGDPMDTNPPEGTIFLDSAGYPGSHPTVTATNTTSANFLINATDTYNAPYGMKIWGDNNGSYPAFEDDASWEAYGTTKSWTLSAGDGYKYIFYKFMDAASNETEIPIRLKISLDVNPPIISAVTIDAGAIYNNSQILEALISVDAFDATSGLSEMRISVDGVLDSEIWEDWIPSKNVTLPAGDGVKTVIVQVRDFVNLTSATQSDTITLDLTEPTISFDPSDSLEVKDPTIQNGTFADNYDIASYFWEIESGPGNIIIDDKTLESPTISADADGEYVIRVTVSDDAGNSAFGTIPFIWDTTAPGTPEGSAPIVSVSNYYSIESQPTWSWTALPGADKYRVSFASTPDWNNADASGFTGYIETSQSTFSPSIGLSDGLKSLSVKAYDNAGNSTAVGSEEIYVDTSYPIVENDGNYYLKNNQLNINNVPFVYDNQSGLANVLWEKEAGPGSLTITSPTSLATGISADTDGLYTVKLTVNDIAGNATVANYTLVWDTIGPSNPLVSAPSSTPDSTPTWNWESDGDGSGNYRYEFINRYNISSGWITTTSKFFTAPDQLAGIYTLTLNLQDKDEAGNWSTTTSHTINIDTSNIVAPFINAPTLTNDSTPTWNWTSGAGADPAATYQWSIDNPTAWSGNTNQTSYTAGVLTHGNHTLYIREYYNSAWRSSSKTINVDLQGPNLPLVSMTQSGTSTNVTKDTTPNFTWTSGGGAGAGIFQYRYRVNTEIFSSWSTESTSQSFTYGIALSNGNTFTIEVRERDQAGNWSSSGSELITIDTDAPVPSSISIDASASYTGNVNVDLGITSTGSPTQMRFYNSGWTGWVTYNSSYNINLPSGDGVKYVYVQLMDSAGNTSNSINDGITLDTTAPVINSFKINNGAVSSSSTYTTLNSNVTDTTPITMYVRNGITGGYTAYSYSTARSWYLTSGYGTKRVEVYYVDAVGNSTAGTTTSDMIFYGQPSISNTYKGKTTSGLINITYSSYPSEYGTNTYNIYTATSPTGTKTLQGSTTGTSFTKTLSKGILYYVFIGVSNPFADDSSTSPANESFSDRYSSYMIAYSSNQTIIYDDDSTTDTTLAGQIRTLLEWTAFPTTYSAISGTMPDWEVTLVPEDEVSGSFTTVDDRYIIYGDPVIITPGTTLYTSSNKTRNIVHRSSNTGGDLPTTNTSKAGIFAMGYGGTRFLDTVETYWTSWGYPTTGLTDLTQYPTQIGYGESATHADNPKMMYQWTSGNSTWNSPLSSTSFVGGTTPTHNSNVQISYADQVRYSMYNATGSNPANGYIYGKDANASGNYYAVVRQGRFLQYGFNGLIDRTYTGKVYFINLIARMDNY